MDDAVPDWGMILDNLMIYLGDRVNVAYFLHFPLEKA